MIILQLMATFAFIGAFSFGGGYGMLPLIQEEVVYNHGWLTIKEFSDILAIAEMTPGPVAINTATYVGYKMAGLPGSAAATAGVVLPSFVLILTLAGIVLKNKDNPHFQGAFRGLRPVVVALVIGAALMLGKEIVADYQALLITAGALAAILLTKIHPILVIMIFGVLGVFL